MPMAAFICALAILISLVEGLNIGLLVPLLESFQDSGGDGEHWISRAISSLFDYMGIPFGINSILIALAVLVTFTACLKYLRLVLLNKLRAGFTAWLRSKYMWNLVHADLGYHHNARLGVMTDFLTTHSHAAGGSVLEVVEMVANLALLIAYLVAAFLVAPYLTAGALGVLFLISLSMQIYVNLGKKRAVIHVRRENEMHVSAVENLSGIAVLKSFLLERIRWLDFSRTAEQVGEVQYQISRDRSQMTVVQEITLFGLIGGIVYLGVSVLDLNIAVIVALLFILYRLAPKVTSLNNMRHSLAESMVTVHALYQAMSKPAEVAIVSGQKPFTGLQTGIELADIDFSYNGSSEVLRGTSFTIEKGGMTAIVGASGAGKSTLIDMLLRFYDPIRGSILVDGMDLRELDLTSWRGSMAVVSQDIFLFNDSVANNISLQRPNVTTERVVDAATQAYAHDFIQGLPQGYDTTIGDRGWNLSGGQRQRIALARAIVGQPQILILDEATSSLDSESEQLIQNYITEIRGSCTLVVVAHRMATIRSADKIVVLQDGRITEEGDWNSLVSKDGVFASYQHLQAGG